MEKISLKRVIKMLLIILPLFILVNIIVLSFFGFDFPFKTRITNLLENSSIIIYKITCTLQGRKVDYLGPNGWVCKINCKNGYKLPKIGDIGLPTDTEWPPCYCRGEWINEVCES